MVIILILRRDDAQVPKFLVLMYSVYAVNINLDSNFSCRVFFDIMF